MIADISVVIPYYNADKTIFRALRSIEMQTVGVNEIIIVNDGSDYFELENIAKLFQSTLNIRLFDLKLNFGAAHARNVGIENSSSTYIAFLDADDSWHPNKIEIQYTYLKSKPDIALCGHQCICFIGDSVPQSVSKELEVTKISANSLLFKNAFSTPTVIMKRNISLRFQESKRFAEDILLWQQIAFSGLLIMRIESPLAFVHKPFYGVSGLSAQLWKMEGCELSNFFILYRTKYIGFLMLIISILFSIIKFLRRLFVVMIN